MIRVVTINTGKGDGAYPARVEWLIAELHDLKPDLVACQEVFVARDGSADTGQALADGLGLAYAFAPARLKARPVAGQVVPSWSGLGLLTRGSWLWHESLPLPSDPSDGERIALIGTTELDGRLVVASSVHLTHLRGADSLRRRQLHAVLAHPALRRPDAIRLLCGDFNTTAPGDVLAPLIGATAGPRLLDAYAAGAGAEPRGTLLPQGALTESRCIDFIFSVAGDGEAHPAFGESRVVLNRPRPDTGIYPSDHFGVATTVMV